MKWKKSKWWLKKELEIVKGQKKSEIARRKKSEEGRNIFTWGLLRQLGREKKGTHPERGRVQLKAEGRHKEREGG